MKASILAALVLGSAISGTRAQQPADTHSENFRVILVGTAGGPVINTQRTGIGTLVIAGVETLLFDCGRAVPAGLTRVSVRAADVTKVFLTHLHSDHVIALPE